MPDNLDRVTRVLDQLAQGTGLYYRQHLKRYAFTLGELLRLPCRGGAALEIGYSDLFQFLLGADLGMSIVLGTEFRGDDDAVAVRPHHVSADGRRVDCTIHKLNIELEMLPLQDESLDLVLCCEVIEHMDVDPMYPLAEFNRVLKPGGWLVMTTPNSTSYANVAKVLLGYRPHFYMQYHKNRSRYRHNFEHDRHSLMALTDAAGFDVDEIKTADVFEEPHQAGIDFCAKLKLPNTFRGDCLFYSGRKASPVRDRFPAVIYV